jgi:hypothetical protein
MVTMTDVAKLAGVSTMTVSNVLNNRPHVREELRQRVLDAVDASGYVMNNAARSLRRGSTGVIGLAVPELDRPYFGQLAARVILALCRVLGDRVADHEQLHGKHGDTDGSRRGSRLTRSDACAIARAWVTSSGDSANNT